MILAAAVTGYLALAVCCAAPDRADSEERSVLHYSFEAGEDLDLDDLPDEWVRRKGAKFPRYVTIVIDGAAGCDGSQSLRMDANGGAAALYSPLTPIDDLHTYHFHGKLRTRGLKQDVAVISVSLLNERRERLQRFLTTAVGGELQDWTPVNLGPIVPSPHARFVVIGCHLVPGDETEIAGSAWFDDLTVTCSPRLAIESDYDSHFRKEGSEINVTSTVSGLEPGRNYQIQFEFRDAEGEILAEHTEALNLEAAASTHHEAASLNKPHPVRWQLDKQEPGFYRLTAILRRDGQDLLREETSLAVMRLVEKGRLKGEFGWSLAVAPRQIPPEVLANIAAQAGINWMKFPVWNSVRLDDPKSTRELADFFDHLNDVGISTVGILSDPPESLRAKFARNWLGVSEIFSTQSHVWWPTLEPVVARFSSTIHHWQIGAEEDSSFEGMTDLDGMLQRARGEINRIGINADIGIPWQLQRPIAGAGERTLGFVSLRPAKFLDFDALRDACQTAKNQSLTRWVVLKPDLETDDPSERANRLVRQMLAAKVAGVEGIFIDKVIDSRCGLLQPDGAPAELFLPWRTTALALQDATYLGEIHFPHKSRNAVFARNREVVIFIWNDSPEEEAEQFYLGEEVVEVDLWGRAKLLESSPKGQTVFVNSTPKILMGCSEAVARWRLATQFAIGKIRSEYGSHEDAVVGRNTFPSGVSGRVVLETPTREHSRRGEEFDRGTLAEANSGWQAEPREWQFSAATNETFRLPVFLTLPNDANLGDSVMKLTFQVTADRPYNFDVLCPYQVGLEDVTLEVIDRKLPNGQLEIEQVVKNNTNPVEVLDFRCSLKAPDSRRQRLVITKLGTGEDRKFYYLDNADDYHGKELRLRIEQDGGGRIMNYHWNVGKDWQPGSSEAATKRRHRTQASSLFFPLR